LANWRDLQVDHQLDDLFNTYKNRLPSLDEILETKQMITDAYGGRFRASGVVHFDDKVMVSAEKTFNVGSILRTVGSYPNQATVRINSLYGCSTISFVRNANGITDKLFKYYKMRIGEEKD